MKKSSLCILFLSLILALCSFLSGCEKSYDDIMSDFYQKTYDEKFNAINIDLGNNIKAIYFIEQNYGLWVCDEETHLFDIYSTLKIHSGGDLVIKKITSLSYYKSIVESSDERKAGYYGDVIFSGYAHFSKNGTVASFFPDDVNINEMSSDKKTTVKMTKVYISSSEILSFDVVMNDMNFVSDDYFKFVTEKTSSMLSCEMANLWVDSTTMTGEWITNGTVVPIRMKIHEKVPYIEVFDIRDSSESLILKAYAKVLDSSTIELIEPEGSIFYTTPTNPVTIIKTN